MTSLIMSSQCDEVKSTLMGIVSEVERIHWTTRTPPRNQPQPPREPPPPRSLTIGRTSSGVTEEELIQAGLRQAYIPAPPPEFIIDTDVVRALFTEDREGDPSNIVCEGDDSEFEPDPQWRVSPQSNELTRNTHPTETECSLCSFSTDSVRNREGASDCCVWRHCGPEDDVDPEYVCTSCTYEGLRCGKCGLSETFFKACQQSRHYRETGDWFEGDDCDVWSFIRTPSIRPSSRGDYQHICLHCAKREGLIEEDEWYDNVIPNWGEGDDTWGSVYDEDGTYLGEYENEELPEDNSEKMKSVKDAVQDVGEFVFDLQEKLPEGDYLKLMDLLQKVTNAANS